MKTIKICILSLALLGCNALFSNIYLQNASSVPLKYNNGATLSTMQEVQLRQNATQKPVTVLHKNKTTKINKNGYWFFSDHGVYFK